MVQASPPQSCDAKRPSVRAALDRLIDGRPATRGEDRFGRRVPSGDPGAAIGRDKAGVVLAGIDAAEVHVIAANDRGLRNLHSRVDLPEPGAGQVAHDQPDVPATWITAG